MDTNSPIFIAFLTAALTSIFSWAYAKYVLKQDQAEKVLAKTVVSGVIAATLVSVYANQTEPKMSLHSEPFFAPIM